MKIKVDIKQATKYTEEEKRKLFAEGHIRSFQNKERNKKAYTRKEKYKNKLY